MLRPDSSLARWASTSLTFMFVEVPDPVWKRSTGNWSSWFPDATCSAADTIAAPAAGSMTPSRALVSAAQPLIVARAWMTSGETPSPLIRKLWMARWVLAPQSASTGTAMSPRESCSVLL